jgi:hypothetical protein
MLARLGRYMHEDKQHYTRRLVHCLFHGGRDDLRLIANYEPALPARAYERAREAEQTIHFGEL